METENSNLQPAKFRILAMDIAKMNIDFTSNPQFTDDFKENKFGFKINFQCGVDDNIKCVFVIVSVDTHLLSTPDIILGSISIRFFYEIENYEEIVERKPDGTYFIETPHLHLFSNISASSTRGVMFGLFKGTVIHSAYLPIIDVTKAEMSLI